MRDISEKRSTKPGLRGGAAAVALLAANPAYAQCVTSTVASTTTITCGDTVTTDTLNTNGNNPSTSAYLQRFPGTIDVTINNGATISGNGLYINGTGSAPITVTNNGTISNTTAQTTAVDATVDGLRIEGNGGAITYRGNGNVTTNAVPNNSVAVGLIITNTGGGDINIGSQATPVTGIFRGESAVDLVGFGTNNINAYFNGGTLDGTETESLYINTKGNITLVTTGQTVLTNEMVVSLPSNALPTATLSVTTDAHVTNAAAPAASFGGGSAGTSVSLTSGASFTGLTGIAMFSRGGELKLTTAANTTITATGNAGLGVQLQPNAGTGTIVADLSGTINAGGAGLFIVPADGAVSITIREGASVNGTNAGAVAVDVLRLGGGHAGPVDILNLGTISSPGQAANFDGTLRIGNGGTSGTISGNIADRGTLIFDRSDSTSYGGSVSGTGALTKQGAGTLTLSGASSYSGATTVSAGTLNVTGSLTSAVTVASGAKLAGTGSVGSTTINGTLSPGGDGTIGTTTINGNLVFGNGSTFRVDIGNSGAADRVNVTGTATLTGAVAAFATGSNFSRGTYTLLNAAGGINGTFALLTTTPNAGPTLRYDANNVFLEVAANQSFSVSERQSIIFAAPTVTANHINAYSTQIIGRLVGGQPLYDQTFAAAFADAQVQNGLSAARLAITNAGGPGVIIGAPTRISSTTTSTMSSVSTYSLADTQQSVTTISTFGPATITTGALSTCYIASLPSTTRPTCQSGGTTTTVADGNEHFDQLTTKVFTVAENRIDTITDTLREVYELNGQVVAVGSIHAQVQSGLFDLGGRLLGRLTRALPANAGWGELYAFRVDQGGRRDARGLAAGFNLQLAPGVTLAFGIDHGNLDIDVPGALETGKLDLTEGGAGLRIERGGFAAALSATFGAGNADTLRTIIGSSRARYDLWVAGAAVEIGYAIKVGGWTLRPVAGFDYVSIRTDGFTESDALGLHVAERKVDRLRASAGAEIGRTWGKLQMTASARYLSVLDGKERSIPVAFAIAPGRLLDMAAPSEPDTASVGARARLGLSKGTALWFAYDGRFGKGYEGHTGTVGLTIAW